MYISLPESRANAFKGWSETRQPPSNDDANDLVRVDALAVAAFGSGCATSATTEGSPWDSWGQLPLTHPKLLRRSAHQASAR